MESKIPLWTLKDIEMMPQAMTLDTGQQVKGLMVKLTLFSPSPSGGEPQTMATPWFGIPPLDLPAVIEALQTQSQRLDGTPELLQTPPNLLQ